jgi:putative hydrolase of the HAD superfamily
MQTRVQSVIYICQQRPEPAIFEYVLKDMELEAKETVFLDDLRPNIRAASQLGMNVIHVVDTKQAMTELRSMLGLDKARL